jgi:hypothetical protein
MISTIKITDNDDKIIHDMNTIINDNKISTPEQPQENMDLILN